MLRSLLRRNVVPIGLAVAAFAAGVLIGAGLGVAYAPSDPGVASPDQSSAGETPGTTFFFVNNATVVGLLVGGVLTMGTGTALVLFQNGAVLGASTVLLVGRVDALTAVLFVLPHGLLEFPAFWLAGAAALRIPVDVVSFLTRRSERAVTRTSLVDALALLGLSLALLLAAAVVEAHGTTVLLEHVGV